MNRQALRSVCTRARPELRKPGPAPANYFSTGQWLAAESDASDGAPNRSLLQRSRAAVGEISSLLNNNHRRGASTQSSPAQQRQLPTEGSFGGPRNVIDVRTLPRGSFRGRGGFRGQQPGTSASRGRLGARGGRGKGRGGRRREGDEERGPDGASRREDPTIAVEPAEREFDDAMRFGVPTLYNPSLTKELLADYMPATPTAAGGYAATALQNLSLLGATDPVGAPTVLQADSYARDLEDVGVRFFADAEAREATEQFLQQERRAEAGADAGASGDSAGAGRIIQPADEAVRRAIVDQAIIGRHEAPRFATDPVGVARAMHLRAETYSQADVDKFEEKLQSLLSKPAKAGAESEGAKKAASKA